jgi:hypothetical protein
LAYFLIINKYYNGKCIFPLPLTADIKKKKKKMKRLICVVEFFTEANASVASIDAENNYL